MDYDERLKRIEGKLDDLIDWARLSNENRGIEEEETWLTTAQAAKMLNMPRGRLLSQIRAKKIAAIKTCPASSRSRYEVSLKEVMRILEERKTQN